MTKRIHQILAVAVTACALTLNGFAQPERDSATVRVAPIALLFQNPEFVKMLELTPQQVSELQRIWREFGEATQAQSRAFTSPNPPPQTEAESRQHVTEARQRMETLRLETLAKVDEIMNPEQRKIYWAIGFQLSGGLNETTRWLSMPERSFMFLDLSDTQKEQVRKLVEDRDAEMMTLLDSFIGTPRDPETRQRESTAAEAVGAKFAEQLKSLLTAEQRAKAEKLTAEAPVLRERLGLPPLAHPRAADAGR